MGVIFPISQSLGTSPDCYNFSDMMDSCLEPSSAGSLRVCRCTSSGRMNLCTSSLYVHPGLHYPRFKIWHLSLFIVLKV